MRKYFKGVPLNDADGWTLSFVTGNSIDDNKDWVVDTNSLHGDQVPNACNDSKTCAMLMAGLLNCFYNNVDASKLSEEQVIAMGVVDEKTEAIPSPQNPKLPF